MMKIFDRITGRDKLKLEIKHLNFQHDVANALIKSLARDAGVQQSRGDSLLKAVDKARAERNEANNQLSAIRKEKDKLSSDLSAAKKQLTGVLEMKGISEEEAGQLWGASNDDQNFGTQSRVLWREGKKAFRAHQMAVSETFDAMEKHLKQGKTLTLDDVQYYRDYASDAIGRKI